MSSDGYSYEARLRVLQAEKLKEAKQQRELFGAMDRDEGVSCCPPSRAERS